jgi:hypothetical protein
MNEINDFMEKPQISLTALSQIIYNGYRYDTEVRLVGYSKIIGMGYS